MNGEINTNPGAHKHIRVTSMELAALFGETVENEDEEPLLSAAKQECYA